MSEMSELNKRLQRADAYEVETAIVHSLNGYVRLQNTYLPAELSRKQLGIYLYLTYHPDMLPRMREMIKNVALAYGLINDRP